MTQQGCVDQLAARAALAYCRKHDHAHVHKYPSPTLRRSVVHKSRDRVPHATLSPPSKHMIVKRTLRMQVSMQAQQGKAVCRKHVHLLVCVSPLRRVRAASRRADSLGSALGMGENVSWRVA